MANVSNSTLPGANFPCFRSDLPLDFQREYFTISHSIAIPLNTICVVLSTTANFIILLVVHRTKQLQQTSSLLLYSLNFKDIIIIAVAQTLQIFQSLQYLSKDENFCIGSSLGMASLFMSFCGRAIGLLSMILISIDRFIAIHKPHKYRICVTKRLVFLSVAVVWVLSIATGSVAPFLTISKLSYLMILFFGSTALLVTFLQIGVYYGVRRQRSRIAEMNSSQLRRMALERAVATVVFYIILGLAICYIPFLSSLAILAFQGTNYVFFGRMWFQFSIYANALVNPLVMFKTNRQLRLAVVNCISKGLSFCENSALNDSSVNSSSTSNDREARRNRTENTQ